MTPRLMTPRHILQQGRAESSAYWQRIAALIRRNAHRPNWDRFKPLMRRAYRKSKALGFGAIYVHPDNERRVVGGGNRFRRRWHALPRERQVAEMRRRGSSAWTSHAWQYLTWPALADADNFAA